MCHDAWRRLPRTYPGLLTSGHDAVRSNGDPTYNAGKNSGLRKGFSEWIFIPNPILDDDNGRLSLVYSQRQLLWDRVLVDGFVAADDEVEGFLSFSSNP